MKFIFENLQLPILLAGIGNTLKTDDAAGPKLIEIAKLKNVEGAKIRLLNCGESPENFIRNISSHLTGSIVFVDAVHMNKIPGTIDLLIMDEIEDYSASTHSLSLKMLSDYIRDKTSAGIYMLGIQPKSVSFGEGLSREVETSILEFVENLSTFARNSRKKGPGYA